MMTFRYEHLVILNCPVNGCANGKIPDNHQNNYMKKVFINLNLRLKMPLYFTA